MYTFHGSKHIEARRGSIKSLSNVPLNTTHFFSLMKIKKKYKKCKKIMGDDGGMFCHGKDISSMAQQLDKIRQLFLFNLEKES